MPRPTQEQFDAMHDTQFVDWWDAECERVQAQASSEFEVNEVFGERAQAHFERWGA